MGKSKRFGSDQSFKSHRDNGFKSKTRKPIKSGWEHRDGYSDRDMNRRIHQGDLDDYDY